MSSAVPAFPVPSFSELEPGDGQRWSTWFSTVPSQRGPRPFPDWVVTDAGAFDTELGAAFPRHPGGGSRIGLRALGRGGGLGERGV